LASLAEKAKCNLITVSKKACWHLFTLVFTAFPSVAAFADLPPAEKKGAIEDAQKAARPGDRNAQRILRFLGYGWQPFKHNLHINRKIMHHQGCLNNFFTASAQHCHTC
jgi:hypothetical protein